MTKLYTCKEIADLYKVKTSTVWNWVRKKKLEAIKIGRDYRISQEQLDAFIKASMTIS